ncbi:PEP-CTERM sorting domain-containing protein [Planctomycetota bacterium]
MMGIDKMIKWQSLILAAVIIAAVAGRSFGELSETALMLSQTPSNGGTITPGAGVHKFGTNTEVILTAIPQPGYQFVYWLGDVSDPASSTTVAYTDSPKIIIAVFEKVGYAFLAPGDFSSTSSRAGLTAHAGDHGRPAGAGRIRYRDWDWPGPIEPEEPDDFPVPEEYEEEDDFPVPNPEPATGVLLLFGSMAIVAKRKPGNKVV